MIQQVLLPKLGETMTEATIEKWRKAEGDTIERGEVLLEITTDKATLEVESLAAGVVRKILAEAGATLPVNAVIALVGEPGDALPDLVSLKAAAPNAPVAPKQDAPAATASVEAAPVEAAAAIQPTGRVFASPRAKRVADDNRIPLAVLRAGPEGRITEADVLAYLKRRDAVRATQTAIKVAFDRGVDITALKGTAPDGRITKEDVLKAPVAQAAPAAPAEARVELSAMRRVVADRMSKSKREAPHFYLFMDVDMTDAAALRKSLNAPGATRIAFHDVLIRACAVAMREQPAMNVSWAGDHLRPRSEVNIGLAVALDEGLIVPVVRNADQLDLKQTALATQKLIEKARGKRLGPNEYEGGCLTISNLGMFGVDSFLPIINPGESAILGVGRIVEKPVVREGKIEIRAILTCTLSADHRCVDGAIAAKFLQRVRDLLEAPGQLAG